MAVRPFPVNRVHLHRVGLCESVSARAADDAVSHPCLRLFRPLLQPLEAWPLEHRRLSPLLHDGRDRGIVPLRTKLAALLGSAVGYVLFLLGSSLNLPLSVAVATLMLFGVAYVFSCPS